MRSVFRRFVWRFLLFTSCAGWLYSQTVAPPIPIKVVVVAMFERGEDTGDAPGEFQLWVEREHLDQVVPLPSGLSSRAPEQGRSAGHGHRGRNRQGGGVGDGRWPGFTF